jgi:hypothetical protein
MAVYLSLDLCKGRPSYRRSSQKRTSTNSKYEILNADSDADPATQINADPDSQL